MAWRDSRRSRRRLALYSASIVLGVAALIAIGSLGENLQEAIEGQAKTLLGADLVVASNSEFTDDETRLLASLGGQQAREVSFSSMVSFPRSEGTRLMQVRALDGGFPFYGSLETLPAAAAQEFRAGTGALVEASVMGQFGLKVGDPIRIGEATFDIRGSLQKVPGETAAFLSMAPRAYISLAELPKTGLMQKGSLVRHRVYFKFGPGVRVESLVAKVRSKLEKEQLGVETVEQRKRELGRAMSNLYHFLNLVGFVALLLGGIGIASAIHVHVKQRLPTVAILRSLGCTARQAFGIYFLQSAVLGLGGVLAGTALGVAVQFLLPRVLADFIPVQLDSGMAWLAVARGASFGLAICLLFALLPLLAVRHVPPLAVLRASVEPTRPGGRDPLVWVVYGLISVGLIGFAMANARDWKTGLGFALGVGLAFALLAGVASGLSSGVKRIVSRVRPFVWRQGLASLYRPNNRTVLLLVSLGLGTFLVVTLSLLETNLVRGLLPSAQPSRPDAVLFDIQTDQRAGVIQLLKDQGLPVLQEAPVVTMRLTQVKGRSVERLRKDPRREVPPWALRREYRSTYRDTLVDSEKLLSGKLWPRVPAETSPIPVSVEEGIAKTLKIGLGDELIFDVQGVPVRTVVASLREVDWRRLQPNFFVVFPLGVLEDAPSFHVIVTRVGSSATSAEMQRAVVRQFPNVSTIDLTLIVKTLDGILGKISFVVRFMALFTIGTGLIVLVTSILTGRYQRLQEAVLLRTLGASRRQIQAILLIEYLCLGSLAAAAGIILAASAAWGLSVFLFKIHFALTLAPLLLAWATVAGVTVLTGLLTSRGLFRHPPLEILRSEG